MRIFRLCVCLSLLALALVGCADSTEERSEREHPERDRSNNAAERTTATPSGDEIEEVTETADEVTQKVDNAETMADLQREIESIVGTSSGRIGVVVEPLSGRYGGMQVGVGQDEVFRSASMIKVLILAELLREVDAGEISLDEPLGGTSVGALAESMITVSDNEAANLLIERIGFDRINAVALDLGLESTTLQREMLDYDAIAQGRENYTSASDMATLFEAIWKPGLLSRESRRFALDALAAQRLNTKIPAGLPSGTRLLHKTGELDGIEHDGGVIITPDGPVVLVVLTEGDPYENIQIISVIAAEAYDTFA